MQVGRGLHVRRSPSIFLRIDLTSQSSILRRINRPSSQRSDNKRSDNKRSDNKRSANKSAQMIMLRDFGLHSPSGTLPGLGGKYFAFYDDKCNPRDGENERCVSQPQRTLWAAEFWVPSASSP